MAIEDHNYATIHEGQRMLVGNYR